MLSDDDRTPRRPSPTSRDLRRVMGRFATGVTVLTTSVGDEPHGMTANSLTSVSLDPPLVLVCVMRDTVTADLILEAGRFAVSVLAEHQDAVARHFADRSRPAGAAQFAEIATTRGVTGAPRIDGAIAWLEADVHAVHDGGDHLIVVGRVVTVEAGADRAPLLFHEGRLTALDWPGGAVA